MFSYRYIVGVQIALVCLMTIGSKSSGDVLNYAGMGSRDGSAVAGGPGGGAGPVSLYTGQHTETVPLFSLPTDIVGGLNFTLSYSGNVSSIARADNRLAQASWVGLGFELGTEYIIADHKYSYDLADDDYYYVGPGGTKSKLLFDSVSAAGLDCFSPSNGQSWFITREAYLDGTTMKLNWIIEKENGTRFIFGGEASDWARFGYWTTLRMNEFVGEFLRGQGSKACFRWDVIRIVDGEDPNSSVNFWYAKDFVTPVQIVPGSGGNYTRASYIDSIVTSNGYVVRFFCGPRGDYQPNATLGADIEFHQTKRLDSVHVVKLQNGVVSRVHLHYDYLKPTGKTTYSESANGAETKLILTGIEICDSSGTECLPPMAFEYYRNDEIPQYGAMKSVTYSEGGRREIVYGEVAGVRNLDYFQERDYAGGPYFSLSPNVFICKYRLTGQSEFHFDVGAWNGFWDIRTLPGLTTGRTEGSIVAGENWVALARDTAIGPHPEPQTTSLVVLKWNSGAWIAETVVLNDCYEQRLLLTAGNDFVVGLETNSSRWVRRCFFAKKRHDGWKLHFPFDFGGFSRQYTLGNIQASTDLFAIRFDDFDYYGEEYYEGSWVTAYKYRSDTDELKGAGSLPHEPDGILDHLVYTIGLDFLAWGRIRGVSADSIRVQCYAEGDWSVPQRIEVQGDLKSLTPIDCGVLYATSAGVGFFTRRDGAGCYWETEDYLSVSSANLELFPVGGNRFVSWNGYVAYAYMWTGTNWDSFQICDELSTNSQIAVTGEICAVWDKDTGTLMARRHLGANDWSQLETLADEFYNWRELQFSNYPIEPLVIDTMWSNDNEIYLGAARDVIVIAGSEDQRSYPKRWLLSWEEKSNSWDTLDIGPGYTPLGDTLMFRETIMYPRFTGWLNGVAPVWLTVLSDRVYLRVHGCDHAFFKRHQGAWLDVPQLPVVDKLLMLPEGVESRDTIVTEYSYAGGILDAYGVSPRFTRATISTPHYPSDPEASISYTTSYFHNDMDDDAFDIPGVPSPDLNELSLYDGGSLTNGGYLLDGASYLTFSDTIPPVLTNYLDTICFYCSNLGPPPDNFCFDWSIIPCSEPNDSMVIFAAPVSEHIDQTRTYFSLQSFSSHPDAAMRVLVDSAFARSELIPSTVRYSYDLDGRVIETRGDMRDGYEQLELTSYADFGGLPARNVQEKASFIMDGTDTLQWLGHAFTDWNSRIEKQRTSRWHDPADETTEETIYEVLRRDAFDNAVAWTDVEGDVSGSKFDVTGTRVVASIGKADPDEVFLCDVETGDDVSGVGVGSWNNPYGNDLVVTSDGALSGRYSYQLTGTAGQECTPGLHLWVDGSLLDQQPYILSFWEKSGILIFYTIMAYDGTTVCSSIGDTLVGSIDWTQVSTAFDADGCSAVDSVVISIGITNLWSGSVQANFDDIRFQPSIASVSSSVFDRTTGSLLSSSGTANIPTNHEYDSFHRRIRTRDYHDASVIETSRFFSNSTLLDLYAQDDSGVTVDSFVVEGTQRIYYELQYARWISYGGLTAAIYVPASSTSIVIDSWNQPDSADLAQGVMDASGTVTVSAEVVPVTDPWRGYAKAMAYATYDWVIVDDLVSDNEGYKYESIPIDHDQWLYYTLDYTVLDAELGSALAWITTPDTVVTLACGSNCTTANASGHLWVSAGTNVELRADACLATSRASIITAADEYVTRPPRKTYDTETPNYVHTTSYSDDVMQTVSVGYADGLGRNLQTRTIASTQGGETALVSGVVERNALGQTVRAYKPYLDLVGATGIADFTDIEDVLTEANAYYDGVDGPDCGDIPYAENEYKDNDVKHRIQKTAATGSTHSMGSGHESEFAIETVVDTDTLIVTTGYDPDDVKSASKQHSRGKYSRNVSYFLDEEGLPDSTTKSSYNDPMQRYAYQTIDTSHAAGGASEITLRETWLDGLGEVDSLSIVDYGIKRMFYDLAGRIRFVQNDVLLDQDKFIFYKYDQLGRQIEEGTVALASQYFTDANAKDRDFPDQTVPQDVKYRRYFDIYDTIVAPGQLVRVENGDQSYYRNYYYYPETREDLTLVKLPISGGSLKGIRHKYMRDGTLEYTVVYPDWTDTTTSRRAFAYEYDDLGRLNSLSKHPSVADPNEQLTYAEYEYLSDGSISTIRLGMLDHTGYAPELHDTLQKIDYFYDALGRLVGINDTDPANSVVVPSESGGVVNGQDNDHFGTVLQYNVGDFGPFNGRVWKIVSTASQASSQLQHEYEYEIEDRGWLTKAEHLTQAGLSRRYRYNAFGLRDSVFIGTLNNEADTVVYTYDQAVPGSSKLISTSDMLPLDDLTYDANGNLTSDLVRGIYGMGYDYRDMLDYVDMRNATYTYLDDSLRFAYDDVAQRITKKLYYIYRGLVMGNCPPIGGGGGQQQSIMLPGGGGVMAMVQDPPEPDPDPDPEPRPQYCPLEGYSETHYLYDGDILLATFDKNDDVIELFVNGPSGKIATYKSNDDDFLYYNLTDHIGNARELMHAQEGQTPQVVQWYTYHPYGEELESFGSVPTAYRFTGKEHDQHSAFDAVYFGARYYDPGRGIFSSYDKAAQFASGYMYAGNNPIQLVDPDGNLLGAVVGWVLSAIPIAIEAYGYYKFVTGIPETLENLSDNPGVNLRNVFLQQAGNLVMGANIGGLEGVGVSFAFNTAWDRDYYKSFVRGQIMNVGVMSTSYVSKSFDRWRLLRPYKTDGTDWYLVPNGEIRPYRTGIDELPVGAELFASVLTYEADGNTIVVTYDQSVRENTAHAESYYKVCVIEIKSDGSLFNVKHQYKTDGPLDYKKYWQNIPKFAGEEVTFMFDYLAVERRLMHPWDIGNVGFGLGTQFGWVTNRTLLLYIAGGVDLHKRIGRASERANSMPQGYRWVGWVPFVVGLGTNTSKYGDWGHDSYWINYGFEMYDKRYK